MKINEIINETTAAGGVASVAMPIGTIQKRVPATKKKKKTKSEKA